MRQEIELYLGGRSVEFNEPPEILFSYIRTDYTDPTVLRNSYSKTLTIEGTPNNNQIFNSIYHLDQIVDISTFNPAKRMDFQLFSNGDILEQGYAKLDKINKNEKNISYDITLYGGLGEFLYNLSYDQTLEGSDTSRGGGEDRRLSSLVFYNETEPDKEFDFEITKETVAEAWDALEKGTGATKWQYINFAPAYNGYPKDFDADKVLINTQGSTCPVTYNNNGTTGSSTGFPTVISQGDSTYRAYNNYAIGELPKEMTEWEMRDLRSYLQRPVMSMKGFINAISNPINNGNYNVVLDSSFFNSDNPYYEKAWVTLPQLKKDETETGVSAKTEVADNVLSIGSELGESYDLRYYLTGLTPGAVYSGINVTFSFKTTIAGMEDEVLTTAVDYNAGGIFARDAAYYSSIFVQLVGEDENGNPIAASPVYNFTSPYGKQKGWKFIFGNEYEAGQTLYCGRATFPDYVPVLEPSSTRVTETVMKGAFKRVTGNNYVWYNQAGNQSAFTVSLTDKLEYHRVYFRVTKCYKWRDYKKNGNYDFNRFEERIFGDFADDENQARNILMSYVPGGAGGYSIKAGTATTRTELVGSQVKYTVTSDIVRSGDHISKGQLLNFDGTPCDYLLSYCKLFNLYLSKDIYSNTIYIRTRDSFYNGGTIDLEKYIDRSKEISVKPLAMDSRWYDFAYPEDEKGGAAEDYDFNYGVEYGKAKVQTTYEFDSSAVDLLKDNIYQNGVQVQESSKYFTLRTVRGNPRSSDYEPKTVPTFLYNTIDYQLFRTPNDTLSSCVILPPSGYTQTGYTSQNSKEDWLPKLQLNNDNGPIDGTNVLCFYGGFKSSPNVGGQQTIYYLTDDLAEMYMLNGETPCWIWTKGENNGTQQIAKGMTKLPIFSRMLYNDAGNKIDYTWDFGRVRDTYVPVKAYEDKATIYERWWADYIADLYDPNTRVAEVYVKMEGKVVGDWLRAFYWWDNTYWVLTEINDYNITSYATTKCKFVRVNDIFNYTNGVTPPTAATPTAAIIPSTYMIPSSGGTITATVKTSDGGSWYLEYPNYVHPSQVAGTGDTQITLRFDSNPNSDGREFNTWAYRTVGTNTRFWQEGTESTAQTLVIEQQYFLVNYAAQTLSGLSFQLTNKGNSTVTLQGFSNWITGGTITWNGDVATFNLDIDRIDDANESGRTGSASIRVDGQTKGNITIIQAPHYINLNSNGETRTITGSPNAYIAPTYVTGEAAQKIWLSLYEGNRFIVEAGPNTGSSTRYSDIYFRLKPAYDKIGKYNSATTIVQQAGGGGSLVVSPTAITADYTGGDRIMTVNSTLPWSASSIPNWVTLSQQSGPSGQSTVIVTFAENESDSARTGSITITDGTRTATVNLSQTKRTVRQMSVSPNELYFDYTGNSQYITVTSPDNSWSVVSKPDWIVLSQNSGQTGYSLVNVTAPENTGSTTKTGQIIFTDGTSNVAVVVGQPASSTTKTLTLSPSILYVENSGGTPIIHIAYGNRNGDDVSISSSQSWVHPTYVQWTGDSGNCVLNIDSYGVNLEREATITVTSILDPTLTATMTVRQKALPYIELNPVFLEFENTGGTATITLQSNTDWIIDIDDDN